MNETDEYDDVLHNLLHENVEHIHAPADLAERVEAGAKRRRTARRSVTSVVALVAVGALAGILTAFHPGPAATTAVQLPRCAQSLDTYLQTERGIKPSQGSGGAHPPVPGAPIGAVVCRYAGSGQPQPLGDLAGSARITDKEQVARLQRLRTKAGSAPAPCTARSTPATRLSCSSHTEVVLRTGRSSTTVGAGCCTPPARHILRVAISIRLS